MSTINAEVKQYNVLEDWCDNVVSSGPKFLYDPVLFHEALHHTSKELSFPFEALHSWLRNAHLVHVKRTSHKLRGMAKQLAMEYTSGKAIVDLAMASNYPPYLFARIIVEAITVETVHKKMITEAMRNPRVRLGHISAIAEEYLSSEHVHQGKRPFIGVERIDPFTNTTIRHPHASLTRLSLEVMEAIALDPMYGPRHDKERNEIGVEYEIILEQSLLAMDIPFETEAQLRERGTSRTPDILLSCPVGIKNPKRYKDDDEWRVICWIDSKALFGDINTHQTSVLPQAESYIHRFGPGLVLYWFGHAPFEKLDDSNGDIVIAAWKLPEMTLLPTGDLSHQGAPLPAR